MSDKWIVQTHYGDERLTDESSDAPYSVVLPEGGSYPEDIICEVWGTERDDVATAQSICDAHNASLVADSMAIAYMMERRDHRNGFDIGLSWVKDDANFDSNWIRIPLVRALTVAATWRTNGEPDPHGNHYDCERTALTLGSLTDDELANGAYMNYDRRMTVDEMIAPKPGQHMPIVWMTAVKERIRWLSRALIKEQASTTSCLRVLDDDQVMAIVEKMENGQSGFCKQWGFVQFGQKVSAATLGVDDE